MGHATLLPSRRRLAQSAGILILAGIALRVAYAVRCGLGYDEVFVMGIGLDELYASWRALLIDVPLRRSDGITPLWWWVQAVAGLYDGHPSLISLRVGPVLLGGAALLIAWRVAAARLGRGPAVILVGLLAVSDVMAFSNARGEFAESLLIFLALPAALLVGQPRRSRLKGSLWLLLLMTHLGKGAFLVAVLALAEGVSMLVVRHHRKTRPAFRELTQSILIAGLPTVAWLLLLNATAFASGPVVTDAGPRDSVWHALTAITFGYAQAKAHLVAGSFDAMQVYLDGAIWPTTTISAVPLIVGLIAAFGAGGRRRVLALSLLPWIVIGIVAVIGRGILGARFHLLYLPAVWIVASMGLWRLRRARGRTILACGLAWVIHLAVAFSWSSWTERAVGLSHLVPLAIALAIVAVVVALLGWGRPGHRLPAVTVVGFLLVAAVGTGGPWRWDRPPGSSPWRVRRRVRSEACSWPSIIGAAVANPIPSRTGARCTSTWPTPSCAGTIQIRETSTGLCNTRCWRPPAFPTTPERGSTSAWPISGWKTRPSRFVKPGHGPSNGGPTPGWRSV
ncbi:MAG: hypothetical protein IID40_07955 [Planctomycetes bacterium]|nr:hypothetical protein [Planctomycetota bacterium]